MKKKLLSSLVFGVGLVLTITNSAFAENFAYKLYDSSANKAYSAQIITLSISDTEYTLGLYAENNVCAILPRTINTNPDSGLVAGDCMGIANSNGKSYNWREYSPNTFFPEMQSIKQERLQQGKTLAK